METAFSPPTKHSCADTLKNALCAQRDEPSGPDLARVSRSEMRRDLDSDPGIGAVNAEQSALKNTVKLSENAPAGCLLVSCNFIKELSS